MTLFYLINRYEEVLRQLRQGLAKCYAIAFENRGSVAEATITPHTLSFVKKLVATFGIGIENIANSASGSFSSAASESLARRAQATAQDPVFQRMKTQFSTDFDFTLPGAMKLHNLIHKLKKWIKILEAKTKLLPRYFFVLSFKVTATLCCIRVCFVLFYSQIIFIFIPFLSDRFSSRKSVDFLAISICKPQKLSFLENFCYPK